VKYTFIFILAFFGLQARATALTPSMNGANIPAVTEIVDAKLNTWALNATTSQVVLNGVTEAATANVKFILYYNGQVYYENKSNDFYKYVAPTWTAVAEPRVVSPHGTNIPVVSAIVDIDKNIWSMSDGIVYINGTKAAFSAGVTYLLYENGLIYQENTSQDFYVWGNNTWAAWNPTSTISSVDNLTWAAIQARNAACIPFGIQTPANYAKSTHKVFAHYMLNFILSDNNDAFNNPYDYYTNNFLSPMGENMSHFAYGGFTRSRPLPAVPTATTNGTEWQLVNFEREVRIATSIGIDGFSTDIFGTGDIPELQNMLAAIKVVNAETGGSFKLLPVIDASELSSDVHMVADIETILETLRTDPNVMRLPDGRLVFSSFLADAISTTNWSAVLTKLEADEGGKYPAFVPIFLSLGAYDAVNTTGQFDKISYMISTWGSRTPNGAASEQATPATFHAKQGHAGALGFMTGVAPQDFRPHATEYIEAVNSETFRAAWTSAIKGGSDWVQLVTWNDYSENTHVSPSSGTQYGFYDLAAYFISLFKGYPTYIGRDSVSLFYRNQLAGSSGPSPNTVIQSSPINLVQSDAGAENYVEAVVFTDANDFKTGDNPEIEINVGGVITKFAIPNAGLTSYGVPITLPASGASAVVTANIIVGGVSNVALTSPIEIKQSIMIQNFLYQSATATQKTGATGCGFPGQADYDTSIEDIYRGVASVE
jgi:Glycosyl hydrolase family 71